MLCLFCIIFFIILYCGLFIVIIFKYLFFILVLFLFLVFVNKGFENIFIFKDNIIVINIIVNVIFFKISYF